MASRASDIKALSLADQGRGRMAWALQETPIMLSRALLPAATEIVLFGGL